jgi:hypothetical protein
VKTERVTLQGKGDHQETIDYPRGIAPHTGGDPNNRRAGRYGKSERVAEETLADIFDL